MTLLLAFPGPPAARNRDRVWIADDPDTKLLLDTCALTGHIQLRRLHYARRRPNQTPTIL